MTTAKFEEKTYNTESLDVGLWKKIIQLMSKSKKLFAMLIFVNSAIAVIDVARPYLNKIAIDYFAAGNIIKSEMIVYTIVYIIIIILDFILVCLFSILSGRIECDFYTEVREKIYHKVQLLSYSYFDVTPTGWIMSRISSDVSRLAGIMGWALTDIIMGAFQMALISVVMLVVNWKMALMILVVLPFLAKMADWFQKRILKNYREVRRVNSMITSAFNEGIMGAQTTKTLTIEEKNHAEFTSLTDEYHRKSFHAATFSSMLMPLIVSISAISMAFILWYGGNQVILGQLQFGTLFMFTEYITQFYHPLRRISGVLNELQMAQANAERIISLIDEEVAITDSEEVIEKYGTVFEPKTENYPEITGDVEFRNVNFSYIENQPILKNFNLKVKAGQSIALVGETGSGKSTIINLLCRFYQPTSGQILIDGVDYKERSLGWLHSNIGYVLQTPTLFSGTVKDNIRYGNSEATNQQVEQAAKLVDADSFIKKLENGYDSDVGEGGSRLSTGEKQLISFARALLTNPALMILDEATSSVDTETELKIQKAIATVLKGRTSFIVAHRLSTIVNSDLILVISQGEIIEQGTHEELMKQKGHYYKLYVQQFSKEQQMKILGVE